MRIATWNVNSLKARQEAVEKWLARAEPDVLLIQETKLSDGDAPEMPMRMLGYEMAHHGEGRWNGVAILSRVGIADVVTNFGDGPVRDSSAGATVAVSEDDFDPFGEARMVSAVCGGVRVVSLYAPNGREVGSPFYEGKLRWFERLGRWLAETQSPSEPLVLGGDYNVTPADLDVWSPAKAHGGTHVSEPGARGAGAAARLGPRWTRTGPCSPRPAASPGGTTGRACSTRTRACGSTCCTRRRPSRRGSSGPRSTARRARVRPRRPTTRRSSSTSTSPGSAFDAGWEGALGRIAARTRPRG